MRRLHPADHNTFDLITQDQILDTFNKLTGVFFLSVICLALVYVGLQVLLQRRWGRILVSIRESDARAQLAQTAN